MDRLSDEQFIKELERRADVFFNECLIAELEKIKEEIQDLVDFEETCCGNAILGYQCLSVINNKITKLKGETK